MFNLLKDYWNGDYREIPWGILASIVAALLYVLSPIDLVPDIIPLFGLADDAVVVALCMKYIHDDLEKYKKFKEEQRRAKDALDIEEI